MSEPVQIEVNKSHATIYLAAWCTMGVLALVLSIFGLTLLLPKTIVIGLLVTLVGLGLFASALDMSLVSKRTFLLKEPVLEFSEHGFLDRRICVKQIPWASVRWKACHKQTGAIQFEIDSEVDSAMQKHLSDKVTALWFKLLKLPRYTVSPSATGKSSLELEEIFSKFKPPMEEAAGPVEAEASEPASDLEPEAEPVAAAG
ncbi:hypothetical protein [Rhodopirellula sp. MGV]|uniref:hypothetical protein n=1 Tax=Rhodopirellula sp. MGV TaxID=2023130 RepID=UPI000B976568|nr:hypothetical protein [Rhodopirellula sp. MGV]OYP34697.1 hypothetical protein CGZ80_13765 [Rhodopirellula sp. MGV]PNY34348.1 hypothetical protein C2E31_24290 [Rhodopirellula baltica]